MTEPDRKQLQEDLRALLLAHLEYEELLKKVCAIGQRIRQMVLTAEEKLDKEN